MNPPGASTTTTQSRSSESRSRPVADPELVSQVFGGQPFRGRAAVEAGVLTRRDLARDFTKVLPGIYLLGGTELDAHRRVRAAALWAPPDAVTCGFSAALLLGERYFAAEYADRLVELLCTSRLRTHQGIRIRVVRSLGPGADSATGAVRASGVMVTSPARTAVDLLRWVDDDNDAIAAVDSLCNTTRTLLPDVASTAMAMRPAHGVSRALSRVARCDPRADSPPETRLRLGLARHDLPTPDLQFPIFDIADTGGGVAGGNGREEVRRDGRLLATADLGFRWCRVALFYDGRAYHGGEQGDYDAFATARMTELGWEVMRITDRMAAAESALMRQIGGAVRRQIERGAAEGTPELRLLGERWRNW